MNTDISRRITKTITELVRVKDHTGNALTVMMRALDELGELNKSVLLGSSERKNELSTREFNDDPINNIITKCEQFWNEHNLTDEEVHASLGLIHKWASILEATS